MDRATKEITSAAVRRSGRIAALRDRVLARKNPEEVGFLTWNGAVTARSLRASENVASWQIRRGLLTRDRLASAHFDIDDRELLAGRLRLGHRDATESEYEEAHEYLKQYPAPSGQTGHCELDYGPIMAKGIDGLCEDIRQRLSRVETQDAPNDTAAVYQSFLYALEGLSQMIENAAVAAGNKGTDYEIARIPGSGGPQNIDYFAVCPFISELEAIAASCRRIAHKPPASFRDAIQLIWFMIFGVMFSEQVGLVVPGHLDRTLYPFYAADRAKGVLSREDALELIACLYLLINEFIPDGLAMSVMVGGRDSGGRDASNELSYLCFEALPLTRLIYPTVGLCWHDGTPPDLVELAVEIIGEGCSTPAFFGDETIQRGLKSLGVPEVDACRYINSTCVEITPCGGSNVWVASPYFSTCKILMDEIGAQVGSGDTSKDFESLRQRYNARLIGHIADAVAQENKARLSRQAHGRKPLQSVFTRDCIARGRDIDDGGAVYNWVECSFVGLANLTDSLHVIREEVFAEERLTLGAMKEILDCNFEGHEAVRQRFLKGHAKYGQDEPEVDALLGDTVAFLRAECAKHKMLPDDSPFVPGAFCWIMHEMLGRECGATPDGRKAGTPFADGCGPAQGRESLGPTAAILSTTSWDHSPMIGGLAYNMKFNRSLFDTPEGFEGLRHLVLTFLRRGGFETQINVTDAATLKKAREHPEAYRDLVVRIGGYCDYFTRLSPQMQDEIILRTEFTRV